MYILIFTMGIMMMNQFEMASTQDLKPIQMTPGHKGSGEITPKEYWTRPAEIREVKGEKLKLSADKPQSYAKGTRLAQIQTLGPGKGTTAYSALDPSSLIVRSKGQKLQLGTDYLVDPAWGVLGIGPNSKVSFADEVEVDYRYSLLRIDSLVCDANGHTQIVVGQSDLTIPQPPTLDTNQHLVANMFVDYFSSGKNCEIFKICKDNKIESQTSMGLIPKTLNKLKTGKPVRIICWGDSVTGGGDASDPEARYTSVFDKMLRSKFPAANIATNVIAVGGSNSRQWLYPDKFKHPSRAKDCNFAAIVNSKPDLVTIEFVNDAGLIPIEVNQVYSDIIQRLNTIGSEIILITPHFTSPALMNFESSKGRETRKYVFALKDFAKRNNIALADVSARWEHLQCEGLPYVTLLRNGINHPDDRGHAIFAQELIKCFEEKSTEGM